MKISSSIFFGFVALVVMTGCAEQKSSSQTKLHVPSSADPYASESLGELADELPEAMPGRDTAAIDKTISDYLGDYSIKDEEFGTEVAVTVSGDTRKMVSNALPNHETGVFPNDGNPNAISAQNLTYNLPLMPQYTGAKKWVREPGVAINGVKFEPETAERVTCASGETYKVEAMQDLADLGLDHNNAHVQPTGAYHYHGVAENLIAAYYTGGDLVHVGFALDGHLMLYSKSGAYTPSYELSPKKREGTDCDLKLGPQSKTVTIDGTTPDGTYVSDWVFDQSLGNLDECNGTHVDGTYVYFITEDYPYIPRCLMGTFTESAPLGGAPGNIGQQNPGTRPSPSHRPPPRR